MDVILISILTSIVGVGVGAGSIVLINNRRKVNEANKAGALLEKAQKEADKLKREYLFEAKEEAHKLKLDAEKDIKDKKNEAKEAEERLITREKNMDRRDEMLQNREKGLEERDQNLVLKQEKLQKMEQEIENVKKEQVTLLEKIGNFSRDQAREVLMKKVEELMDIEIATYIRDREAEAKLEVDRKAKELLVESMERYAADVASEQTISVITLPNDEMKGRIIGREGRNIRTIEAVTGVDLIIDDTPEAIVISSFDPLRREIAKLTIETLIKDGRIHPARIEELYDKSCKDMNTKILEYGQEAIFELGITKVAPEIVELIGKLHFRSSYGQNALEHSKEVAHLAGIMAAEIGENVPLAKRAALLHDIGKAIDFEVEGSHIELGLEVAQKHREHDVVLNAIQAHHGVVPPSTVISNLVTIADALSASRPGARNDSLENYIKRLHQLEEIANSVEGVEKTYAIQAGRELRILVNPDAIDDVKTIKVAREIKDRIEKEMKYPGTVKVTVIRETRAVEEAR